MKNIGITYDCYYRTKAMNFIWRDWFWVEPSASECFNVIMETVSRYTKDSWGWREGMFK